MGTLLVMRGVAVLSWSNASQASIQKLWTLLAFAIARLLRWLLVNGRVAAGACGGSILIEESEESVRDGFVFCDKRIAYGNGIL
uniref:Secreted protein n=1 Tax=Romanomermis culicivorax TaxID=13658 RepID=A0A915L7Q2_ROMCU